MKIVFAFFIVKVVPDSVLIYYKAFSDPIANAGCGLDSGDITDHNTNEVL